MMYPAWIGLFIGGTDFLLVTTSNTRQNNFLRWTLRYKVPRLAAAGLIGAGIGLTTCLLSNAPWFEKHPYATYFTSGYMGGALWGLMHQRHWGLGRCFFYGIITGLMWQGVRANWYECFTPLIGLDSRYGDSNW